MVFVPYILWVRRCRRVVPVAPLLTPAYEVSAALLSVEATYVHVNSDDVPSHDSHEVQQLLPPPHKLQVFRTGASLNGTDDDESDARDPLLSRDFLRRADDPEPEPDKMFIVASYNILCECHALNGFNAGKQYKWSTAEKLTMRHRHTRLWAELEYLNADVYCLQEVPPWYFKDTLVPAFEKYEFTVSRT